MAEAAATVGTLDESVLAPIQYVVATGEKPVTYLSEEGMRGTRRAGRFETVETLIRNGRPLAPRLDLEREGFVFRRHHSAVADFYDDDTVRGVYYPELEAMALAETGAERVVVFDHTIRAASEKTQGERGVREPVHIAHNDYTDWSAPNRVRDLLPEEAEALLRRRFGVLQVWRPVAAAVQQQPLAICDAQSIRPDDLLATDLVYKGGRTGEVLQLARHPDQRWYYFPDMTRDEALVFKTYDSATDGRARFSAHTAFADPASPPDAPERVSIEARMLVFY